MAFAHPDILVSGADGAAHAGAPAVDAIARGEQSARIVEGVDGILALESTWRRVARASPDRSVFQGFGFAASAARYHEKRGERVLVVVVECGGRPACILPIAVRRRGGVSVGVFLGDPIAQYGDALVIANAPARIVDFALKRLVGEAGIDVFEFRRVRDDSAISAALQGVARQCGAAIEASHADLSFEKCAESFLQRVGGAKQKRERARSRRRLGERGDVAFETLRGEAAIEPLRHAFALKRTWLARQGDASPVIDDPRALAALEDLACDCEDGEGLVVGRLSVEGAPAAYEVGLIRGRRFHAYLGAVADEFAFASPGKIVMEETLSWCRANGIDVYDLLPPADPYKRRWSNGSMTVRTYVAPTTLAGKIYSGPWLRNIRPGLRSALEAMPATLRRRLGSAALKAGAA